MSDQPTAETPMPAVAAENQGAEGTKELEKQAQQEEVNGAAPGEPAGSAGSNGAADGKNAAVAENPAKTNGEASKQASITSKDTHVKDAHSKNAETKEEPPAPGMGAMLIEEGVAFRVWAPHAEEVSVI